MFALTMFESPARNMHWQNYQYNGPLTPEMEMMFKKEASRALSRMGSGSLGFSVSTSVTTVNGVTACLTEFHVGKETAWTAEETAMLDARFAALASDGEMVGPNGRSLVMSGLQQPKIIPIEDTPVAAPRAIKAPLSVLHTHDHVPSRHSQVSPRYANFSRSKHSRKDGANAPSVNNYAQPHNELLPPTMLHHPTPLAYPAIPRSALSHHSHHPTHANDPNGPHAHFAPSLTEAGTSTSRRLSKTPAPGIFAAPVRSGSFKSITSRFKKTKETSV
ncbi:hypothetical protein C343_00967 [Cryptococcus neoformans C23]|uniref:Uncharacterized protein n=1 Tax=Cryptococcus neoformans (strain H99 / ATCC 208821 / CBS 10515 / FGSC 9487) TaxID=235443 RepID=J9VI61_CRYN9|nr:hypothetical protein CNAG_06718 [Cryptococcus neoformans var. grubii H99]AUB22578.1 hypothetical protein CKF44_06718 [Cryptococcus neoformans var. grubii]OWZ35694.1 hypothetical protein C347_01039 [Cryptococcus neoformans var. grubii AD2-60a]OWZ47612.1 hypothetical protein C343_00967 [Cryptococcus neoformans var. grubii C23]OXC86727.1 hypothetical protein C344_00973 [Cryptococcus neoformans var. grubii AD1-7a]OXG87189.1 hypothetical protein C350_00957 [Cryptococcus neoformans var. grubii MW|eukprot:XP_012047133.1 hypothetical protein CNAG_06718 [Cryptococcus neoformans var. grubii H99]